MQLQQIYNKSSKIEDTAIFLHIWILLVKTVTAIYNTAGKFWSLKIQPMRHFQVHGTYLVLSTQIIYLPLQGQKYDG